MLAAGQEEEEGGGRRKGGREEEGGGRREDRVRGWARVDEEVKLVSFFSEMHALHPLMSNDPP